MRFHPIFLLFFLAITAQAQRRTTAKSEVTSDTPRPSRSRGRSRFAATPEYQSFNEASPTPSEPTSRRVVSRKRVPEHRAQQQQPAATETIERRSFIVAETPERRAPRPATEALDRRTAFTAAETPERRAPRPATEAIERRTAFVAAEPPERRALRPATEATERRTAFVAAETPERRAPRPSTEATERRTPKTVQKPSYGPSYQVEEVVDEGTHGQFRKLKKTRVLTESHFEAQNLPRRNSIKSFPTSSEYPELLKSTSIRTVKKLVHHEPTSSVPPSTAAADDSNYIDEPLDTTLKTLIAESSSEESTSEETEEEIFKTQPVVTTPKSLEAPRSQNGNRRSNGRRNQNTFTEATSQASRSRTRTRGTKAPEFVFQAAPAAIPSRGSRRRVESSAPLVEGVRNGPSVFSAELAHIEGRSRTGRKIEGSAPEKITLELPSRNTAREKSREQRSRRNTTTKRTVDDPRKRSNQPLSFPSRGRSRSREIPPVIDESKLEVLPLFETEPKIVNTGSTTRGRSRDTNRADDIAIESRIKTESNEVDTAVYVSGTRTRGPAKENFLTSATEEDMKITKPDRVTVSVSESRSLSSRTDPTSERSPVRESVISEVSEITSRRTVPRRKNLRGVIKPIENKPTIIVGKLVPGSRGTRKSEINLTAVGKKRGPEEIDEADNYPESFKALIKAKNGKKESRASSDISASTNIVTSSSTNTRSTTEPVKEINDQENELEPKSPTPSTTLPRSARNRSSHTSTTFRSSTPLSERRSAYKKSTIDVKSTPSTLFTTPLSRHNKYKGKHAAPYSRNFTSQKFDRNVSFRPREGYSTERNKKDGGISGRRFVKSAVERKSLSTKIPKYSSSYTSSDRSKYRNEFSRGAVVRSTTSAPRYIPTIPSAPYVPTVPTVTPTRTTVFESGDKDSDLGLEVISFNDPVRPVQSANLISDDYVSPTANSLTVALPLVIDGTTEKPVSIIERIINSITAISTSSPPSVPPSTASTTESASAILKLAPKKTRQLDSTEVSQTYATTDKTTTEKPTTIIERILSSLNAIQATDNTSSAQVRTDFNTLSFTTTPSPKTARPFTSRNTLPEHISTTVNPLSILDEITPDQALQKRTIGKLLDILNGMVSTTESPEKLVVVTPKSSSFFPTTNNELFSSTALPLISTNMPGTTSTTTLSESTSLSESTTLSESSTLAQTSALSESSTTSSEPTTSVLLSTSETMPSITTVPSLVATSTESDPTTLISTDIRNGDLELLGTSSTTTEGQNGDSESVGTFSTTTEGQNKDLELLGTTEGQIITTPSSSTPQSGTEASSSTETTSFPSTTEVDQSTRPTNAARALSLDSISTSTTPTETNIASSRTPQSTIRTESRFALPDTGGTTSTQSTTTTTGTTSTTSGTTSTTRGSTLGSDSTTSSSFSAPEVTTADSSNTVGSMSVDMVTLESSTVSSTTLGSDANPTLETLSQLLLNGRTLEAFNDIVNSAKSSTTDTDTNQTPQGDQLDLTTASPPSSPIASTTTDQSTTSTVGTSEAVTTPSAFKAESATLLQDPVTLSNDILGDQSSVETISTVPTAAPTTASTTTTAPTTTPASTTTTAPTTTTASPTTTAATTTTAPTTTAPTTTKTSTIQPRYTSTPITTLLSVPTPKPTAISTLPSPTTFFPSFFTTLFPGLFTTERPALQARSTRAPQVVRISAAPTVTETVSTKAPDTTRITTTRATTKMPTTTTTVPTTTTTQTTTTRQTTTTSRATTTRQTTTTTEPTTTTLEATIASTTTKRSEPVTDLNTIEVTTLKKVAKKQLTQEQMENLRTLQKLEEEQANLLKQLSFLTSLNFGGANPGPKRTSKASKVDKPANDNLAERVIELALERDKAAKSGPSEPTTTTKQPTSIQDQLAAIDASNQPKRATPSIEDVLKQYNLSDLDIATTPKSAGYGKSTDAILASLLKEQGIAPSTPKSLGDQIKQSGVFETTSKKPRPKPKPTTQRPQGPLMRGLDWLLNALAPTPQPPAAKKPAKPVKPKKPPVDQELLANSPTHITPVVTPAPPKSSAKQPANALTQDDIQKLIKQLEVLQNDPSKGALDLSQIKSIQNLINTDEGVVVMANGEHGATSRRTTTTSSTTTQRRQQRKLVTRAPLLTVSNSVEDVEDVIPTTPKPMRPPIGFNPVPGVDDDSSESLIRSNLITAAVNVTKAISGFLGTALQTVSQGAAQSFQSLLGSGSSLGTRVLGNVASGSSAGPT